MWAKLPITNRYLRQLQYELNTTRFVRSLHEGDKVLVLDPSRVLFKLIKKKEVQVYHERTEHPNAYTMRTISINQYKAAIHKVDALLVGMPAFEKKGYTDWYSSLTGEWKRRVEEVENLKTKMGIE